MEESSFSGAQPESSLSSESSSSANRRFVDIVFAKLTACCPPQCLGPRIGGRRLSSSWTYSRDSFLTLGFRGSLPHSRHHVGHYQGRPQKFPPLLSSLEGACGWSPGPHTSFGEYRVCCLQKPVFLLPVSLFLLLCSACCSLTPMPPSSPARQGSHNLGSWLVTQSLLCAILF